MQCNPEPSKMVWHNLERRIKIEDPNVVFAGDFIDSVSNLETLAFLEK